MISIAEIAKLLVILLLTLKYFFLAVGNTEIRGRFYELRNLLASINVLLVDLFNAKTIGEDLYLKKFVTEWVFLSELKLYDP